MGNEDVMMWFIIKMQSRRGNGRYEEWLFFFFQLFIL